MGEKHYDVSPERVAEEANCTTTTVRNACHDGKIDYRQDGPHGWIWIERNGYQEWLNSYRPRGKRSKEPDPAQFTLIEEKPAKQRSHHRDGGEGFEGVIPEDRAKFFHEVMTELGYTYKQDYMNDLLDREYHRLMYLAMEKAMTPEKAN